jgi:hypothetical protein
MTPGTGTGDDDDRRTPSVAPSSPLVVLVLNEGDPLYNEILSRVRPRDAPAPTETQD